MGSGGRKYTIIEGERDYDIRERQRNLALEIQIGTVVSRIRGCVRVSSGTQETFMKR